MSRTLIVGAGGFIGGHLAKRLAPTCDLVCVDKKPLSEWHHHDFAHEICADCSDPDVCDEVCRGRYRVFNLAADMGGMGFIENNRVACLRSVLINTNLIEAAWKAGVQKYFYASSACVYNAAKQTDPNVTALKESDAYPAMAERGYGWEKLFSEMVCQEYTSERGLPTFIARFHNVYGPKGTWQGGREKAPAALCRKVIEAQDAKLDALLIWGDGTQTRSFMFIDDCIEGILKIVACPSLVARPVNLGSSELVSINELVSKIETIAGVKLNRHYDLSAPKGVNGRNSDNSFLKDSVGWEPSTSLDDGLRPTYEWIREQYYELAS